MEKNNKTPKVFISYTWDKDNPNHEIWVMKLATDLRKNGVDAILDKFENRSGADLPHFMDASVRDADRVLCIITEKYTEKANDLIGGVGYEYRDMTAEMYEDVKTNKFIPILRKGSFNKESIPTALFGRVAIDMRDDSKYEEGLEEILRDLFNKPKYKKPPLGPAPNFD